MTRGKIFPLLVQGRRALYSRWQLSTLNGTLLNFSKLCELRLCRESQKPDNSNTTRSSGAISFRSFCSLFKFTSRGVKCFGLLCFFSFMKIAQNWILLWVIAACRYFFVSNEEKKSLFAGSLLVVHWLFSLHSSAVVFCVFCDLLFYGLALDTCGFWRWSTESYCV